MADASKYEYERCAALLSQIVSLTNQINRCGYCLVGRTDNFQMKIEYLGLAPASAFLESKHRTLCHQSLNVSDN